jgi:dihydropteroate synthase
MTTAVPGFPHPERCLVMGVVNVTPDSFSDGGRFFDPEAAIAHGLDLVRQGADVVDVGGESTRPGAQRVSAPEELRRVIPVIRELSAHGIPVSVDTMRAEVAAAAIEVGARLINDVSGGLADAQMAPLVAKTNIPYVVMHWRGHSHDMNTRAVYADPVGEVVSELSARVEAVLDEGVDPSRIVLDPGLGFAKRAEHDLALLARLDRLLELGYPVMVGASRKRFIGRILAGTVPPLGGDPQTPAGTGGGGPRPFTANDDATLAITAITAAAGAWCVRVHNVRPNADAVRVAAAIRAAR